MEEPATAMPPSALPEALQLIIFAAPLA